MRTISLLFLALTVLFPMAVQAQSGGGEYFFADEFFARNPGQRELSEEFAERIRGASEQGYHGNAVPRVAFVLPGEQVSDYWRRSIDSFSARLDELGLSANISKDFTRPNVDVNRQAQYIAQLLRDDPDYLVFTLDAARHRRLIETLLIRKRPKVILQNITTPLRDWEGKQPFLYVGFDHVTGSRMLADHFIEATGGRGDYAVILTTPGYLSTMRGASFVSHISENSLLKLKGSFYIPIDRNRARTAAEKLIDENPALRFIYASTTDIALGTIDAVKAKGLAGKIMVNGWGGGSAELEAIQAGDMDVTVMRMNDDNGAAMADAILLDVQGRAHEVPTIFSGDFVLVKKGITDAELDGLRRRAFRYSR